MARLPRPGSDDGQWGDILNGFLAVEHNIDGTLRSSGSLASKVELAGDLTGSVTAPRVSTVHLAAPLAVSQGGTGAATQTFPVPRGLWQAQTAYAVNDVVSSGGSAWRCTTAHTSSNVFQSQVISGYWEQWAPRTKYYDVRDYGARVDGTNDDAAALAAAITAAYNAGGGTVFIPSGFCMTGSTIELKKHVWLRGAGMFATSLKLLPNANCDVIKSHVSTNGTTDPNADFVGIFDITIDGNKANQTAGTRHGIVFATNPLTSAASGDNFFDMHHTVQNVRVYKTGGDAVHMTGRSETRLQNVYAAFPDGNGFVLTFDTFVADCTAESAGLAGFMTSNGATLIHNCKAFNCGAVTPASGQGFYVNGSVGGINVSGCYAQNNQAQGFLVSGSSQLTLTGCTSDSNNMSNNSFAGFELYNSTYCIFDGAISMQGKQGGVQVGNQTNALRIAGSADKNMVRMTHSGNQNVVVGSVLTSDSVLLTNAIYVNGSWLNPLYENQTNKGAPNGYAGLDANGLVPTSQLPSSSGAAINFGLGFFGDGSDGTAVLDGTSSFAWATLAGSVYKLLRNVMLSSLTVNSGITLNTNGFIVYCRNTVSGAGVIASNGGNSFSATGGAGLGSNAVQGGKAGGAGGSSAVGGAGTAATSSMGGIGGAGGNGASTNGGAGGTLTVISAAAGGTQIGRTLPWATTGYALSSSTSAIQFMGPGSGGAGGGGDGVNAGGGGGGSAGVLIVNTKAVSGTLTFQANGGSGFSPAAGDCGGGGGGGGGCVVVNTTAASGQTLQALGGTPGNGHGAGTAGTAGANGLTFLNIWT